MSTVVDLQGFSKSRHGFVVKEVAILTDGMVKPATYRFAPPFPWHDLAPEYKRKNAWLERNYIGLKWNSGSIPYNRVQDILLTHLKDVEVIYVKGHEKVMWLHELLGTFHHVIKDLEEEGCPSLQQLKTFCAHHRKKFACAEENVNVLAQWVAAQQVEPPSADRSIRLFHDTGSLTQLTTADLACLPKSFLLRYCGRVIDQAWPRLPDHLKNDSEIAGYRKCFRHHNIGECQVDGPPPMIKDCHICQSSQS